MTDLGTGFAPIRGDAVHDRTLSDRAYRVYSILKDHARTLRPAHPSASGALSIRDMPIEELLGLVGGVQSQLYWHLGDLQARNYLRFTSAGRVMTITFPRPRVASIEHPPASPVLGDTSRNVLDQPATIPDNPE